jgi:ammonia channel protein AmtB
MCWLTFAAQGFNRFAQSLHWCVACTRCPPLCLPALLPAGVLAGLVSITAPCAMVTTYGAAVIGIVGGLVYSASSRLLVR